MASAAPRPIIVGQAPGPNTDPLEPLSGRSGARLAALCGIGLLDFLDGFDRVNLLPRFPGRAGGKGDAFPMAEAREAADRIRRETFCGGRSVVMLGRNVAAAFAGTAIAPHFTPLAWLGVPRVHGFRAAMCPHPSGVCRWWNHPANEDAARMFWQELAGC